MFLQEFIVKLLTRLKVDGQLPKNWIMGLDAANPTFTGIFYLNGETGEASWDFPIPLQSVVIGMYDKKTLELLSDKLPLHWQACVDPGSGKEFYHHTKKGITSWERPPMKTNVELPAGWQKLEQVVQGGKMSYYANMATKETRRSVPFFLAPEAAAELSVRAQATQVVASRCRDPAVRAMHQGHAALLAQLATLSGTWLSDDDVYRMQTGLLQIKRDNATRREMFSEPATASGKRPGRLPPGWSTSMDPAR